MKRIPPTSPFQTRCLPMNIHHCCVRKGWDLLSCIHLWGMWTLWMSRGRHYSFWLIPYPHWLDLLEMTIEYVSLIISFNCVWIDLWLIFILWLSSASGQLRLYTCLCCIVVRAWSSTSGVDNDNDDEDSFIHTWMSCCTSPPFIRLPWFPNTEHRPCILTTH